MIRLSRVVLALMVVLVLAGCASLYLKHPTTNDVVECDPMYPIPFPAGPIIRETCRSRWVGRGYVVVDKCEHAKPGEACATKEERDRAH